MMKKDVFNNISTIKSVSTIWLKALLVTATTITISWLIIEHCSNSSVVVVFCVLSSVCVAAFGAISVFKIRIRWSLRIIITCLLPTSVYLVFVIYMVYIIFVANWNMQTF